MRRPAFVVTAAILAAAGLSACASSTMTASAPDLHDACVLEFGKDGKPKRMDVRRAPLMGDTMWFQNREVRVSRVFTGTRLVLRGADAAREPACSASNAPNIG